ncbi:MAG TPA: chemotaxis-specific protein-glutamate methyltransferase CheB [Gemmatimonadaceae bacterium]|nr:chemotaxis-specific protein-glutamate methyltransferase CheB [Gemmatimonadaceae bacterium]
MSGPGGADPDAGLGDPSAARRRDGTGGTRPIRVLVVEDSPTVRQLLVAMLGSDPQIDVVGEADNGLDAVRAAVRLAPDLITMDVNMPGLDGLAATKEIMAEAPTAIIIVSSTANQRAVSLSLDATRAGALMVLPKPESPLAPGFAEQRAQLVSMAKAMAQVKVVRRWASRRGGRRPASTTAPRLARRAGDVATVRLVAIGCSTGGPAALQRILGELPADFPVPIAVVQHMAPGFVHGLATWLDGACALRVRVATEGERLQAGTVYLAGDDRQFGVARDPRDPRAVAARLTDDAPVDGFRPSATHLFASVARALGADAAGVILTGMGRDGVDGLMALRRTGAPVLAQDEASSVVYGMAREAVQAGAVTELLPLDEIAGRLQELVA